LVAIRPVNAKPTDPIFASTKTPGTKIGHGAMLTVMRAMGEDANTVHGFRATFRDWTKINHRRFSEEAEKLMDHKTSGSLGRAYERDDLLDSRYELCQWWAQFLQSEMPQDIQLAA
jgi:integrase